MRAICLAKGSRDDAQPVAVVARALQRRGPGSAASLVTHLDHKGWLNELLSGSSVRVTWLKSAVTYKASGAAASTREDLTECAAACCSCISNDKGKPQDSSPTIIICNLAALEGVHLAEALGIPCIVISPGYTSNPPPKTYLQQLQSTLPGLYQALQASPRGKVGLVDVQRWMWPLFDSCWCDWRTQTLGLPPTLYQSPPDSSTASDHQPHKHQQGQANNTAANNSSVHVPDTLRSGLPQGTFVLPECVPLLVGVSQSVVGKAVESDASSVKACGFWTVQDKPNADAAVGASAELDDILTLYPALKGKQFAKWQGSKPLVCILVGSTAPSGLLPQPAVLFKLLTSALEKAGLKGILLTDGCMPFFFDMWMPAVPEADPALITDSSPFPPLAQLLPRCKAIIHTGSSAATAAALAHDLPQIIYPFSHDQEAMAKQLCDVGVALQGPDLQKLHLDVSSDTAESAADLVKATDQLSENLQEALSGSMHEACQQASSKLLEEEDGVGVAVEFIHQHMQKHAAVPQLGNLKLPANSNREAEDDFDQELVKLPNGWQVSNKAEMEGLFIYNEIFQDDCYGKHGIRIADGDTVVDVGANVGMFVYWALRGDKAKGRGVPGHLFAVEPLEQNRRVMEHNLKRHNLTSKVQVIPQAVGSELGELQIRFYPNMPGNSTCHVQEKVDLQGEMMPDFFFADSQDCTCPVTTVSQLMEDHGMSCIDLLKVDVEGCELEVLQGVQVQDWVNIKQIVLELHDVGNRLQDATDLLAANGFVIHTERDFPPQNVMIYGRKGPDTSTE